MKKLRWLREKIRSSLLKKRKFSSQKIMSKPNKSSLWMLKMRMNIHSLPLPQPKSKLSIGKINTSYLKSCYPS